MIAQSWFNPVWDKHSFSQTKRRATYLRKQRNLMTFGSECKKIDALCKTSYVRVYCSVIQHLLNSWRTATIWTPRCKLISVGIHVTVGHLSHDRSCDSKQTVTPLPYFAPGFQYQILNCYAVVRRLSSTSRNSPRDVRLQLARNYAASCHLVLQHQFIPF